jgi:hypothetical protein
VNEFGFIVDENGNPSMRFEIARATLEWLSKLATSAAPQPTS